MFYSIARKKSRKASLIKLSDTFHGLSALQLGKINFELAVKLKIKHNFNKQNKVADRDSLQGFLKRNPMLSLRKPEVTSIKSIQGYYKIQVNRFFTNLEKMLRKYHFISTRIVNRDESGTTTLQVSEIIYT